MVEFKRKKGESFEGFLRRFNKTLIKSRKLKEVRGRKFMQPIKSRNQQRVGALIGMKLKAKTEYLKKIGKIKEETRRRW